MLFRSSVVAILLFLQEAHGFAYAPNFITKIVQEQTAIEPRGLLEIDAGAPSEDSNGKTEHLMSHVRTRFPPEPNGYRK
jgi:hypothetical protein